MASAAAETKAVSERNWFNAELLRRSNARQEAPPPVTELIQSGMRQPSGVAGRASISSKTASEMNQLWKGRLTCGALALLLLGGFGYAVYQYNAKPKQAEQIDLTVDYNPKGSQPFTIAITVSDGPLRSVAEQAMKAEFSSLPGTKVVFGSDSEDDVDLNVDVLMPDPVSTGEPVSIATKAVLKPMRFRLDNKAGKIVLIVRHNTPYSNRRVTAELNVAQTSAIVAGEIAHKLVAPYLPDRPRN